jgi:hypothetical protein
MSCEVVEKESVSPSGVDIQIFKAKARGKPTRSALVVTTQTAFPANLPPQVAQLVEACHVEMMRFLVVGLTISFKAYKRSLNVSSAGLHSANSLSISSVSLISDCPSSDSVTTFCGGVR